MLQQHADCSKVAAGPWGRRLGERLHQVLLCHPGELTEVVVGIVGLAAGAAMALVEAAGGRLGPSLVGGVIVSALAALQVAAAIAGGERLRYAASIAGCAAALSNATRAVHLAAPFASAVFGALTVICLLLWVRLHIQAFGPWERASGVRGDG